MRRPIRRHPLQYNKNLLLTDNLLCYIHFAAGEGIMKEITRYIEELKDRYHLKSDYALAHKLSVTQPEANHLRRGLKVPKEELCIKIAKLLGKNPVELMLVAQKDRAPKEAREYWTLARTAVDVMLHVPTHPRYLPRKVEAIGLELRQMEAHCLQYAGEAAVTAPARPM